VIVFQAQIEINIPILIYYLPEPKQLFQNLSALWKNSYINSVCWENYLHTKNQLVVDMISFNIFVSRLSKSWLRIYASCCLSVALLIPSPNNLILFSYSGYSGGWLTIVDIINAFKIITLKAFFSLLICIWKLTKYRCKNVLPWTFTLLQLFDYNRNIYWYDIFMYSARYICMSFVVIMF